ncbi:MAG: hypothetical protein MUF86_09990 [Akkermansiaceae bacterium]|jgi:hypothetical protein|nr:hypothetical protein [Akkermansiaceae bacterium]
MNAEQLRHILRAAAAVTGEKVFVVIGSQAILGSHPDAPRSLRKSVEGDTYPKNHPHKAIEVDGAIGELSPFHHEFGYYAHGVAPDTATLPDGWEQRLVEFQVNDPSGTIGLCLEKHDLAFSKLAAGREKDIEFIRELLKHRLLNRGKLRRLIDSEKNEGLKQLLNRNLTIVTSAKSSL